MKRIILSIFIVCSAFAEAKVPTEWSGIAVDVKADHPVAVSQTLKQQGDFYRLSVWREVKRILRDWTEDVDDPI